MVFETGWRYHQADTPVGKRWLADLAGRFEHGCGEVLFHTRWIVFTDINADQLQQLRHLRCRRAAVRARNTLRSGFVVNTGRFRNSLCGRGAAAVVCQRGEFACVQ